MPDKKFPEGSKAPPKAPRPHRREPGSPEYMAALIAELKVLGFRLNGDTIEVANEEKAASTRPGTIVGRGTGMPRKIPHTRQWFESNYPTVTFEPQQNMPVIVNGVRWDLFENVPFTGPSIVKDIYDNSRRETRTYFLPKQPTDTALRIVRRLGPADPYEPPSAADEDNIRAAEALIHIP